MQELSFKITNLEVVARLTLSLNVLLLSPNCVTDSEIWLYLFIIYELIYCIFSLNPFHWNQCDTQLELKKNLALFIYEFYGRLTYLTAIIK